MRAPAPRARAKVARIHDRGFAFARTTDGASVFCHASAFADPSDFDALATGDEIDLEIDHSDPRGPQARSARRLVDATLAPEPPPKSTFEWDSAWTEKELIDGE